MGGKRRWVGGNGGRGEERNANNGCAEHRRTWLGWRSWDGGARRRAAWKRGAGARLQEDERDVPLAAQLHKVGALERRLAKQDACGRRGLAPH